MSGSPWGFLSKPCACYHGCPQGLGSCCGDRARANLRRAPVSHDAGGAKAESETHLEEKDYPLQNVKGSCSAKGQASELEKDKEKHRPEEEIGHEFLILQLSSCSVTGSSTQTPRIWKFSSWWELTWPLWAGHFSPSCLWQVVVEPHTPHVSFFCASKTGRNGSKLIVHILCGQLS